MNYQKIQLSILLGAAIFGFSFQGVEASEITPANVTELVNSSRVQNGLEALVENAQLNEAAMQKAQDMFRHNYFAHTSPQDVTPWDWFEKVKYNYRHAGENLAINFKNVEEEHAAWMESEKHRRNILNPNYQEIGVAVQKGMIDDKLALVTVQLFGAREDFQAVPGGMAQKDVFESLGQTIMVQGLETEKAAEPVASVSSNRWMDVLEASSVVTLMLIMLINPILIARFFWRSRKRLSDMADSGTPVKIVLVK